jgi:signal transduction histidine kinase
MPTPPPPAPPGRTPSPQALADENARLRERLHALDQAFVVGQDELLDLQRRLAESERFAALGALLGSLAHELGTPLHSIAGHLQLLLAEGGLPPETRRRLEIVGGEVERLTKLIRRHLTRLRAPEPRPAPTRLADLLGRVLEIMDPILESSGITARLDVEPGVEAPFTCDPEQLEQVALNLIHNARDAMPAGGHLTLRIARTPSGAALSVCDTGSGIPAQMLAHVFEPFVSSKRPGRGSGLGLGLCREIVRRHGGDVLLDSQPGEGTIVTVHLRGAFAAEGSS